MIIRPSIRKDKRFEAIFPDNTKINFGLKGGNTFIDHGDKIKRENYLKRHQVKTPVSLVMPRTSRMHSWATSDEY